MFKPISENEATGKVKEVFDEIKSTRKITEVPNFWKYLANSPETLERTWNSLKQVMKAGALDPVTKELIYVAVSMTNSCEYCTKSHTFAAKKKAYSAPIQTQITPTRSPYLELVGHQHVPEALRVL